MKRELVRTHDCHNEKAVGSQVQKIHME